jgi:hypothetical protein
MSFDDKQTTDDCPREVTAWNAAVLAGNDAFTPGDCHGNNSLIGKLDLMWFCK